MKKQILLLILTFLPLLACADYRGECGEGVTYHYDTGTKTLTISGFGSMAQFWPDDPYTPPLEGYEIAPWWGYRKDISSLVINSGIRTIGMYAFYDCSGLTSVTIGNGVTSIGNDAFSRCSSLTSITIPSSVTRIDGGAFSGCSGLTSLTIPNSVTSIDDDAFAYCSGLTSMIVESGNIKYDSRDNCNAIIETASNTLIIGCKNTVIPSSVASIGYGAFKSTCLTSVTIPNSVTSIGIRAFSNCSGLISVTIGNGVTSIGNDAFSGCSGLTSIIVESGNTKYDSRDNCNAIIETASNSLISGCKKTVIPSSVTSIESEAFYGCSGLTSITIPSSVTSIGEYSFFGCSGLTSVTVENPTPVSIKTSTFSNRTNATLYVPIGSKSTYEATEYWKEFKEIIEIEVYSTTNVLTASVPTLLTGKSATVSVGLDNEDALIAFEFYLQLPDGIRIIEDEDGYPDVTLNSGRSNRHILEVENEGNGLYYFLCYSNSNTALKGNSGELLSFDITCDEGKEAGDYQAMVKNIKFADVNENPVRLADYEFDISVIDYVMGDVNGDEDIDVMDIVTMVSYMMGRNPSSFTLAAADHTGDGIIDVIDLVKEVSLVMSQPVSNAPKSHSFDALGSGLSLVTDCNGAVRMSLAEGKQYVATQFVVTLSEGQQLAGITTDRKHRISIQPLSDNRYFVMSYSGDNEAFTSNDEALTLNVTGGGTVSVEGAAFVDTDSHKVIFQDASSVTTGVDMATIGSSSQTDIYSPNGMLMKKDATTTDGLRSGLYIINGKKHVKK